MKRSNLFLGMLLVLSMFFVGRMYAEEPIMMLNFKIGNNDFKKVTFRIGYNSEEKFSLKVDEGNGVIITKNLYNGNSDIELTVQSSGNVKIYGDAQLITSFRMRNAANENINLSSVDMSRLPELNSLIFDYYIGVESVVLGYAPKLEYIYIMGVKEINLEGAVNLQSLDLSSCGVDILDLRCLSALKSLKLISASIKSLDLSGLQNLQSLDLSSCSVDILDLRCLSGLKSLKFISASIKSLDLSDLPNLQSLDLSACNIRKLELKNLPNLTELMLSDGYVVNKLDLSGCPALTDFTMCHSMIRPIDISHNPALVNVNFRNSDLSYIDLSNNPAIKMLDLSCHMSEGMSEIDLSAQTELEELYVAYNSLTSIDLSANKKLKSLDLTGNKFTFATLPSGYEIIPYYYGGQAIYEVIPDGQKVDLSSQYKVFTGVPGDDSPNYTEYVWRDIRSGKVYKEGVDYTSVEGVFTFKEPLQDIYCEMENTWFPQLKLKTNTISVVGVDSTPEESVFVRGGDGEIYIEGEAVNVEVFNSSGVKTGENKSVFACQPGLYIVKADSRIFKVVVR